MRVLLVVDSSTGYLGGTDMDQKGGSLVSLQNGWHSGWKPLVMHERKCNLMLSSRSNIC